MKNLLDTFKSLFTSRRKFKVQDTPYTYVLVRKDISIEQQLVQAAHATHYAGFRFEEPKKISSLIVLQVADEIELYQAYRTLRMKGIPVEAFFEPDNDMGMSAIATRALYTREDRQLFYNYDLWRCNETDNPNLTVAQLSTVS